MKLQLILLSATIALFAAQANANTGMNGSWKLNARECLSGGAPKDLFVVGRDNLEMKIVETMVAKNKELNLEGEIRVQGKTDVFHSKVRSKGIAFESLNPVTGKSDLMIYNLPADNTLQVFTAGFGADGSCPRGDLLKTTFIRIERKPGFKSENEIEIAVSRLK